MDLKECNWAQSRFATAKKGLMVENACKEREYRYNNPQKIPRAIIKE